MTQNLSEEFRVQINGDKTFTESEAFEWLAESIDNSIVERHQSTFERDKRIQEKDLVHKKDLFSESAIKSWALGRRVLK